jgi:hypothetical protein
MRSDFRKGKQEMQVPIRFAAFGRSLRAGFRLIRARARSFGQDDKL